MENETRRVRWTRGALILLAAAGCAEEAHPREQDPCYSMLDLPDWIIERKRRSKSSDLGIDYRPFESSFEVVDSGRKDEEPERSIVQIIVTRDRDGGELCVYTPEPVAKIEVSLTRLCGDIWAGTHHHRRHTPGSCTGVVLDENHILTAAHCARIWRNKHKKMYIIRGRTFEPTSDYLHMSESYTVDCVEKFQCQTPACDTRIGWPQGPDLMILRLTEPMADVEEPLRVAQKVEEGDRVRVLFHPLGMRMMKTRWRRVEDCDFEAGVCHVQIDNADGGSGGVVLNEKDEIVGIIGGHTNDGINEVKKCFKFRHDTKSQMFSLANRAATLNQAQPNFQQTYIETQLEPCK